MKVWKDIYEQKRFAIDKMNKKNLIYFAVGILIVLVIISLIPKIESEEKILDLSDYLEKEHHIEGISYCQKQEDDYKTNPLHNWTICISSLDLSIMKEQGRYDKIILLEVLGTVEVRKR